MRASVLVAMVVIATCPIASARPLSTAQAHCIITGATGYGRSARSVEDAMNKAVSDCIGKGGVPACCRKGAHPL